MRRAGLVAKVVGLKNTLGTQAKPDEIARARELFNAHDTDNNGVLDYTEFRSLMHSIGTEEERLHPHFIEHFLAVADRDHDGTISFDEFVLVHAQLRKFDELLHAPKRPSTGDDVDPSIASKLKNVAKLVCPPVEKVSLQPRPRSTTPPDGEGEEEGGAGGRGDGEESAAENEAEQEDEEEESKGDPNFLVDVHFEQLSPLGKGGYGVLCSAIDRRSGAAVAIKRVSPTADSLQLRCCLRELAILQHFWLHPHPNLIGLREVLLPVGGHHLADWRDLYLVSERMDMDLQQVIRSDQPLDEEHVRFFFWQLLRGVHALHSAGLLHRDIKPANLLVNANCELKITDYGISRGAAPSFGDALVGAFAATSGDGGKAEGTGGPSADGAASSGSGSGVGGSGVGVGAGGVGGSGSGSGAAGLTVSDAAVLPLLCSTPHVVTLWYRPPELLCGNTTYGSAIDLWSCGIVLAELLGRSPPFSGANHMKMLRQVVAQLGSPDDEALGVLEDPKAVDFLRSRVPHAEPASWEARYPEAPRGALSLLERLLRFHPSERPHAAAALRHPWLETLHDDDDLDEKLPLCPFPFEECDVNLDHFLLASLDAARETNPDYPLEVPEMLRFGVEHGRTVEIVGGGGAVDERQASSFHDWA